MIERAMLSLFEGKTVKVATVDWRRLVLVLVFEDRSSAEIEMRGPASVLHTAPIEEGPPMYFSVIGPDTPIAVAVVEDPNYGRCVP